MSTDLQHPPSAEPPDDEPPSDRRPRFSDGAASILATEHWSLLASRSMAWNEAMSRTTVFLTVLSATIVALALSADATDFGGTFTLFAVALLSGVLLLGLVTYLRLLQINIDEVYVVAAMNRLRRGYLEMAPELAPYLTTGSYDDEAGIGITFGLGRQARPSPVQFLTTTPTVVMTIDAALVASIAGFWAFRENVTGAPLAILAVAAFLVSWIGLFSAQGRALVRLRRAYQPRFPTPDEPETG